MRVLLAAKHPPGGNLAIGGVQSWCATVGAELQKQGHKVDFWGPEWPLKGQFEAGILANLAHTGAAEAVCGRILRISHGIIADEGGGAGFAATSEEVRDRWGCDGPVIRQPLDLSFWTPGNAPRTLLVRHSYRAGLDYLPSLARERGLRYVHLRAESPETVRDTLQRSAMVVATGRAAVEAMACGAPVVIADDRPYQGPLLDGDPIGAMARNYSGRGGCKASASRMVSAMDEARERGSLRAHAETHHDVRDLTARILCAMKTGLTD